MGLFTGAKMTEIVPFGNSRYLIPGTTDMEVKRLHVVVSRNAGPKKGHKFFTAEHTVLDFKGVKYKSVEGEKPEVDTSGQFSFGDPVTHNFDYDDPDYGKINAKEYMAAIFQAYTNQVLKKPMTYAEAMAALDDEIANKLFEGEWAAKVPGLLLTATCWMGTKNDGKEDFTKKTIEAKKMEIPA